MNIFYHSAIPQVGTFCLSEEESKHCIRVLRTNEGDEVKVIDGKGCYVLAIVLDANPKKCLLEIIKRVDVENDTPKIHIAVAPTKNLDRMEWFLEKAIEFGVSEVSFIKCRFSERKELKLERFHKIALSAIKQCNRYHLPQINEMVSFESFIKANEDENKFIAYCPTAETELLNNFVLKGVDTCVLIGPEGDFSKEEVEIALKNKFIEVSLGKSRLRTETAALASCYTLILKNQ